MYSYQSVTRQVIGGAARVLVTLIALSMLGAIVQPLLISAAGATALALVIALALRARLFRWRGW